MNPYFISLLIGAFLLSLTSCQTVMKCNAWTEKDCYYTDYYNTQPPSRADTNYYHSDPAR